MTVGTLENQLTLDHLEICAISFNFEPERAQYGKAIISVVLVHPSSKWKHTVVYEDTVAMKDWQAIEAAAGIHKRLLKKLLQDGKVPNGTIEE